MVQRRFPLVAPRFTVSQEEEEEEEGEEGEEEMERNEGRTERNQSRRDGNREIALATLIFKNTKLQEARGQIDPPCRRGAGRGEPAGGATGGGCTCAPATHSSRSTSPHADRRTCTSGSRSREERLSPRVSEFCRYIGVT